MKNRRLKMFQLRRRQDQPTPPYFSRCDRRGTCGSAPLAACACLTLLMLCHVWAVAAEADPSQPEEATTSARSDVAQSEFERLMAVARQTQQGADSPIRHMNIDGRPTLGAEDAPLAIVEIASFGCPYCRRHWLNTMPTLRKRYIDTGKLRYVFVDVAIDPRHHHAQKAAEAARCANDQGRYAAFRDRIYRHQKAIAAEFLEVHAQAVGIDLPIVRRCMADGRHKTRVNDDIALGRRLRVRGTPSFFWARTEPGRGDIRLIRRISGARPVEYFIRQFDVLYAQEPATTGAMAEAMR